MQARKGIGVAPSPLNPVKLELAVLTVLGVLLWIVHTRITRDALGQLLILGGYGLAAMTWLMMRTRRVVAARLRGGLPASPKVSPPSSHDAE